MERWTILPTSSNRFALTWIGRPQSTLSLTAKELFFSSSNSVISSEDAPRPPDLAGASYTALVEHLRDAGPAYDENKPWNKNMMARIPENAKYIGDTGFPAIISQEAFQKAQTQRKERAAPPAKAPVKEDHDTKNSQEAVLLLCASSRFSF